MIVDGNASRSSAVCMLFGIGALFVILFIANWPQADFKVQWTTPAVTSVSSHVPFLRSPHRTRALQKVDRREALSLGLGTWASLFVPNGQALAFGRGMDILGYQGQPIRIPNAIKSSLVTQALKTYTYFPEWPFIPSDFNRLDETNDSNFYSAPRFVTHIDDPAIGAIREFYSAVFSQAPAGEYAILDLCSSWISHYPENLNAKRVSISGMNEAELQRNRQATDYTVKDLNANPTLPYEDSTFDFVTNVVSVDYLTKPQQVFAEMHRVTKPGGLAVVTFSNRLFITKAIALWVATMDSGAEHCRIVATYFRFSPQNGWKGVTCVDIS
eukprot:EG_transcript_19746